MLIRNTEVKIYLLYCLVLMAVGLAVGSVYSQYWKIVFLVYTFLLLVGSIFLTRYRYGKIMKLYAKLRKIQNGNFKLDVRENREGELSILESEIYKMTLMLTEQAELLRRDKVYLADAISDISHQLKTPLTSMMVMTDLLGEENLPEEKRREFNLRLHSQLERIEWLVSTLLKMSKLDAQSILLKKQPFPAEMLMKEAADHFAIPMDIKEQELVIKGDENTVIIGDLNWMTEALDNILKNCVEHTPEKGLIQISYGENAVYTKIIVEDNGKGIEEKDIPHIFERFYKGRNSSSESVGIGLALARQIILLQGGTIEAGNRKQGGAYFLIKIYKG